MALARPERAAPYVQLAAMRRGQDVEPLVQVLNVTQIPEQTPNEMVRETAQKRAARIEEYLFLIYRYLRRHLGKRRAFRRVIETPR
ncbi:hypothetical protein [Haladaptatus sp. NG-WS-4]